PGQFLQSTRFFVPIKFASFMELKEFHLPDPSGSHTDYRGARMLPDPAVWVSAPARPLGPSPAPRVRLPVGLTSRTLHTFRAPRHLGGSGLRHTVFGQVSALPRSACGTPRPRL